MEDAQILDIDSLLSLNARLSVEPVADPEALGVEEVDDDTCIAGVGGSEDYDLENIRHFLQELPDIRPEVDVGLG